MIELQLLINGLGLGGVYACIAVGFSLVWGVLNVINLLHGTMIVLGSYIAYFFHVRYGIHPFLVIPIAGVFLFAVNYALQSMLINRLIGTSVLMTLSLTFGLDLIFNNFMIAVFKADYRRLTFDSSISSINIGSITLPTNRIAAMMLALALTYLLYRILIESRLGRAIVAVRMDHDAALLMGVDVPKIYSITFGIGGFMAAAAGCILSTTFPISPLNSGLFLGKSFIVCVLGGLGSVPGAMVGGLALGILESYSGYYFGLEHANVAILGLFIGFIMLRPNGLLGKRGFE